MEKFDLIVIGSGAGLMLIEAGLSKGLRCALVEKDKFGGTCLTKGCIPSKMLVFPADMIREAEHAGRIGLTYTPPKIDWDMIGRRMWQKINSSQNLEKNLLDVKGLTVFKGTAAFIGPSTIKVSLENGSYSDEIKSDRIIIAAGARVRVPPVAGLEDAGYVCSETFFGDLFPKTPYKSLAIIGGGPIGAEFAHIFSAMGANITIIDRNPRLLKAEDEDVSVLVESQFKHFGIRVMTETTVVSAQKTTDGKSLIVEKDGNQQTVNCEEIFVAAGIRSNADLLRIDKTHVDVDKRGYILTNEYLETTQQGIWALGDINGKYQLRHKANSEAATLANNLFGSTDVKKRIAYTAVPSAVYTAPQVAHVGLTEREAQIKEIRYFVGINHYSEVVGGIVMGYNREDDDDGFVKIMVGDDQKIIGVHVVGPHAAVLLQPFVYLMNAGQTCRKGQSKPEKHKSSNIDGLRVMCPPIGTYMPINNSMVIHPSLNELTAWVIDKIDWSTRKG